MDNINILDSQGIIKIPNIIDPDKRDKIIEYIMNKNDVDYESFSNSPYRTSITLEELNSIDENIESSINNLIHKNLSEDFYIYSITVHYKDKWLGSEEPWHQDYFYNLITHNDIPENFYRLFISLDEHTKDNGCMIFMDGSHKEGKLDYDKILSIHSYQKNRVKPEILNKCYEKYGLNYYCLNRGDGLLFNSLILHSSSSNQSPFPRRSLQIQLIKKVTKENSHTEIKNYKKSRRIFEIQELEKRINIKNK